MSTSRSPVGKLSDVKAALTKLGFPSRPYYRNAIEIYTSGTAEHWFAVVEWMPRQRIFYVTNQGSTLQSDVKRAAEAVDAVLEIARTEGHHAQRNPASNYWDAWFWLGQYLSDIEHATDWWPGGGTNTPEIENESGCGVRFTRQPGDSSFIAQFYNGLGSVERHTIDTPAKGKAMVKKAIKWLGERYPRTAGLTRSKTKNPGGKKPPSMRDMASDYGLWGQYIDPNAEYTREEFEAMSLARRMRLVKQVVDANSAGSTLTRNPGGKKQTGGMSPQAFYAAALAFEVGASVDIAKLDKSCEKHHQGRDQFYAQLREVSDRLSMARHMNEFDLYETIDLLAAMICKSKDPVATADQLVNCDRGTFESFLR